MEEIVTQPVAVITGAASGIGLAIAEKLAAEGYSVVISDINEAAACAEAERLSGFAVVGDLTDPAVCTALVAKTLERYGRVDVLVNNAGFQHVSAIERFPLERWQTMINLMLTAPFLLIQGVWPSMKARGRGRIINVASVHAQVASLYKSAYISAKHGLIGLTKASALEGAEFGITVNAVCPAYVRTPLVDGQIAAQAETLGMAEHDVVENVMLKNAAIKHLIEPSEVADLIAYLCSDSARSMTGASLNIDSGWTIQ